ncbi:MAG: RtcB family protein [Caldilineaceae bacterium]|nr:RtcB family protein [Caldilineaceae bacterium]
MTYQLIQNIPVWGEPDQGAIDQIVNCARTGAAAALMADHHLGYAMPIGGVIGYWDQISPSGVGFDIACIAAGSRVTLADGRSIPIESVLTQGNLLGSWQEEVSNVGPALALQRKTSHTTLRLTFASGDVLHLTTDHLLRTPDGWREAGTLHSGDAVALSSYTGVSSDQLEQSGGMDYRLLRLFGYAAGDGHLAAKKNRVSFYTSQDEDAARICEDLHQLGWPNAAIHRRVRPNGSVENNIYCSSADLHALFADWGLSIGKKIWDEAALAWLIDLPAHLQAAFLAGLFSAEMTAPLIRRSQLLGNATIKQGGYQPLPLLRTVQNLLQSLGFASEIYPSGEPYHGRQTYLLMILGGQSETIRLWRTIGFPYARYKQRKAAEAMSVVWQRSQIVFERAEAKELCRSLRTQGLGVYDLAAAVTQLTGQEFTHSMALKAVYEKRGPTRVNAYAKLNPQTAGEFVWSPIRAIERVEEPTVVYDLPLGHEAHNFIAGGVVVHNCGNKAVRIDAPAAEVRKNISHIMDDIWATLSFGIGLKNREENDHPLFDDDPAWDIPIARKQKRMAAEQLGTIGSGNHYVDIFEDEQERIWIGVHFGSRGLGHRLASHFIKEGGGKDGMYVDPVLLDVESQLGQEYIACMKLAGRYAYAGRDWVASRVAKLLGAHILEEVHNHHNFAWEEEHNGQKLWVVRKGATPAFPGQKGFVGGSMGDISVILEGVESEDSKVALYSTVHGAGRVMSRTRAAGKFRFRGGRKVQISEGEISRKMMMNWVRGMGVELRGAGMDEAPQVYKRLPEVLAYHAPTIRILHTLTPLGVAMAGEDESDPYKD